MTKSAPAQVTYVFPRAAWNSDVLRRELEATGATWKVQRTAVSTTLARRTDAERKLRRVLKPLATLTGVFECEPDVPQCVVCGCIQELACPGGCGWASHDPWRCTACPEASP